MTTTHQIIPIRLSLSNAYLIRGRHWVLVDTGGPTDGPRLRAALRAEGISPADLGLVIHTHAHFDHCGNTASLMQETPTLSTLMHAADAPFAQDGQNQTLRPGGLTGWLARPFLNRPFPAFTPSLVIDDRISLEAFGLDALIVPTPGHTPGSISVLFQNGDALVGDLLAGNLLRPQHADYHPFIQNKAHNNASIRRVIDLGGQRFYVGHGGPFPVSEVFHRIDTCCFL